MGLEACKYIRSDHNPADVLRNSARKVEDLAWRSSISETPKRRMAKFEENPRGSGKELSEEMKLLNNFKAAPINK